MIFGVIVIRQRLPITVPISLILCNTKGRILATIVLLKRSASTFVSRLYAIVLKCLIFKKPYSNSKKLLTTCVPFFVNRCLSTPYCIIQLYIKRDAMCDKIVLDVVRLFSTAKNHQSLQIRTGCRLKSSGMVPGNHHDKL